MLNTHSDDLLEALDSWVDGQAPAAGADQLAQAVRQDEELAKEAESLRQLGRVLQAARVEVRSDFSEQVFSAVALENQLDRSLVALLEGHRVPVRDGFCASVFSEVERQTAEDGQVAAFLSGERVPVRADFTDQVMAAAAVATAGPAMEGALVNASSDRLWARWGLACAVLLALVSGFLFAASGESSLGLLGTLGEVGISALLAGAGMLGATWSGVGATVDSWLGASILNWSVALLVTAGLVFLCARSVRRQRVRVGRD